MVRGYPKGHAVQRELSDSIASVQAARVALEDVAHREHQYAGISYLSNDDGRQMLHHAVASNSEIELELD